MDYLNPINNLFEYLLNELLTGDSYEVGNQKQIKYFDYQVYKLLKYNELPFRNQKSHGVSFALKGLNELKLLQLSRDCLSQILTSIANNMTINTNDFNIESYVFVFTLNCKNEKEWFIILDQTEDNTLIDRSKKIYLCEDQILNILKCLKVNNVPLFDALGSRISIIID